MQENLNQSLSKAISVIIQEATQDIKKQITTSNLEVCQETTDTMTQELEKQLTQKTSAAILTATTEISANIKGQLSQLLTPLLSELITEFKTTVESIKSLRDQMISDANQQREEFQSEYQSAIRQLREATASQLKSMENILAETSSARGNGLPESKLETDSHIGTPIAFHQQDTDASGGPPRKKMFFTQPAVEPENLTPESTETIHPTTSCLQKNKASELEQIKKFLQRKNPKQKAIPSNAEKDKRNKSIENIKEHYAYDACRFLLAENPSQKPIADIDSLLQIALDCLRKGQSDQTQKKDSEVGPQRHENLRQQRRLDYASIQLGFRP